MAGVKELGYCSLPLLILNVSHLVYESKPYTNGKATTEMPGKEKENRTIRNSKDVNTGVLTVG